MSKISFACPKCKLLIDGDDSLHGQVVDCPSCGTHIVVPKCKQRMTLSRTRSLRTPMTYNPAPEAKSSKVWLVVAVLIGLVLVVGFVLMQAHDTPTRQSGKQETNPWTLMSKAEAALREGDTSGASDALNTILTEFPQSHEAETVVGLVRIVRQVGTTSYKGKVSSCTQTEVEGIKESLDNMEAVARKYRSSPSDEKKRAIDTIFGPGTFSSPDLSLDGLLNAMRQMDAARHKAIRGE